MTNITLNFHCKSYIWCYVVCQEVMLRDLLFYARHHVQYSDLESYRSAQLSWLISSVEMLNMANISNNHQKIVVKATLVGTTRNDFWVASVGYKYKMSHIHGKQPSKIVQNYMIKVKLHCFNAIELSLAMCSQTSSPSSLSLFPSTHTHTHVMNKLLQG